MDLVGPTGGKTRLYIAACVGSLAYTSAGCVTTWTSPTLPKLEAEGSWLPVTKEQGSMVGSLMYLGAVLGPFIGGILMEKIGRKWTLLLAMVLFLVSWAILAAATIVIHVYIARFISGIALGVVFTTLPVYIAEIAEVVTLLKTCLWNDAFYQLIGIITHARDSVRGALGALMQFFLSFGYLFEYTIGPFVTYGQLIGFSSILSVVFVCLFLWMPESPYYLLTNGRTTEAMTVLCWLRGNVPSIYIDKELKIIQTSISKASKNNVSMKEMTSRSFLTALYLSCGLLAFTQLSGIGSILVFTEPIFVSAGLGFLSSGSAIIIGLVKTFSGLCCPYITKRFGIRHLLITSAAGMAVTQGVMGTYFFLKEDTEVDLSNFGWVPVLCLVPFIFSFSFGFGPLPWAVMGEMFPPNTKAIASSFSASFCYLIAFLVTTFFQPVSIVIGTSYVFWFFSFCCLTASFFVTYFLPDTRGMSLQEIQDWLDGNRKDKNLNNET